MNDFFRNWQRRYEQLKKSLKNNEHLNDTLYNELAEECEVVLQTWMKMEDALSDIKENQVTKQPTGTNPIMMTEGMLYFQLEVFQRAIVKLQEEIRMSVHDETNLTLFLGFSHLYEGNVNDSKEAFLYVVYTTTNNIEKHFAYVGLGLLYGRMQKFEEAIHYLEKARVLFQNKDIPYNIGVAFLFLQKYDLAIPYFIEAVKENSEDGEALYFLGLCYMKTGDEANCFQAWFSALQLLEYKDLLVSMAYELEHNGYYSAAIQSYKRLEAIGHREPWVYHGIAWNYALQDERELAVVLFEKLIEENPSDSNIIVSYLWLLSKWNNQKRFNVILNQVEEVARQHPLIRDLIPHS